MFTEVRGESGASPRCSTDVGPRLANVPETCIGASLDRSDRGLWSASGPCRELLLLDRVALRHVVRVATGPAGGRLANCGPCNVPCRLSVPPPARDPSHPHPGCASTGRARARADVPGGKDPASGGLVPRSPALGTKRAAIRSGGSTSGGAVPVGVGGGGSPRDERPDRELAEVAEPPRDLAPPSSPARVPGAPRPPLSDAAAVDPRHGPAGRGPVATPAALALGPANEVRRHGPGRAGLPAAEARRRADCRGAPRCVAPVAAWERQWTLPRYRATGPRGRARVRYRPAARLQYERCADGVRRDAPATRRLTRRPAAGLKASSPRPNAVPWERQSETDGVTVCPTRSPPTARVATRMRLSRLPRDAPRTGRAPRLPTVQIPPLGSPSGRMVDGDRTGRERRSSHASSLASFRPGSRQPPPTTLPRRWPAGSAEPRGPMAGRYRHAHRRGGADRARAKGTHIVASTAGRLIPECAMPRDRLAPRSRPPGRTRPSRWLSNHSLYDHPPV
jgi:hypothetical protein